MSKDSVLQRYPTLTQERLAIVASAIRAARNETVKLHDPLGGDSEWSLGCRVYSRTCHSLAGLAAAYDWFRVLPEEEGLSFSFAIGSVPFRFYRGDPNDPPGRYLIKSDGELHHIQRSFEIEGLRPLDSTLRLAVEVDEDREVLAITLVEMDQVGNVTDIQSIPFQTDANKVTPLQAKPVSLPPPALEPVAKEPAASQPARAPAEKKIG